MPRQTEAKRQIDRIVGKNIRDLREARKMSPKELGDQLGVSADMVTKFERGRSGLNISQLVHVSQIFNVPLERIVYFNGVKPRIIPFLKTVVTG